jgi:hypothetical protein
VFLALFRIIKNPDGILKVLFYGRIRAKTPETRVSVIIPGVISSAIEKNRFLPDPYKKAYGRVGTNFLNIIVFPWA